MTNKIWYVYTDAKLTDHENKGVVQYFGEKRKAEKLVKKLIKLRQSIEPYKVSYIDFMWREDIKQGKSVQYLHGKHIIKVDSILDYLTA